MSGLGKALKRRIGYFKLGTTYVLITSLIALGLGVTYREVSKVFSRGPRLRELVSRYLLLKLNAQSYINNGYPTTYRPY